MTELSSTPPDKRVVHEHRPEDRDVVEVGAAEVAVIEDPYVPGPPDLAAEALLGSERAGLQVAEENRQPRRLA
jgi:hypothetical protein